MNSHVRGTTATGWAQRLGHARHGRDDRAERLARSREADATQATAHSIERWGAIVAAIRRLAEAYNDGARRAILDVVEESGQATVTVTAGGEGQPYLRATLEDTHISMRARDTLGVPHAAEFRLLRDRDNDATAAYLLQNWMQQL